MIPAQSDPSIKSQPIESPPSKAPNWIGNLFSFKGRINRGGFWWFQLFGVLAGFISALHPIVLLVVMLAWMPIFLAVASRRLHDLNKSSWWLLVFVGGPIFVAGAVALIELPPFRFAAVLIRILLQTWAIVDLGFRPGQVGPNRFGADPLQAVPETRQLEAPSIPKWLIYAIISITVGTLVSGATLSTSFYVSTGSQMPTLLEGDRVSFWNFERGYPRSVHVGDLVAYRLPRASETIFLGRVVGMSGDRVRMSDGVIYLNDKPVARDRMPDFVGDNPCPDDLAGTVKVPQWREQLPNGSTYNTLECPNSPLPRQTPLYSVPSNHLFIISDNRRNAIDSRSAQVGYVPVENIVGRAVIVLASLADQIPLWHFWSWGTSVRWHRMLMLIK